MSAIDVSSSASSNNLAVLMNLGAAESADNTANTAGASFADMLREQSAAAQPHRPSPSPSPSPRPSPAPSPNPAANAAPRSPAATPAAAAEAQPSAEAADDNTNTGAASSSSTATTNAAATQTAQDAQSAQSSQSSQASQSAQAGQSAKAQTSAKTPAQQALDDSQVAAAALEESTAGAAASTPASSASTATDATAAKAGKSSKKDKDSTAPSSTTAATADAAQAALQALATSASAAPTASASAAAAAAAAAAGGGGTGGAGGAGGSLSSNGNATNPKALAGDSSPATATTGKLDAQAADPSALASALSTPSQTQAQSGTTDFQTQLELAAGGINGVGGSDGTSASGGTAKAGSTTTISLAQPLDSPDFAPEMAARLSVLAANGVQQAQLTLNPADMGPVAVQIAVDGQQAQITFHASQADTRHVLEQSLPDLAAALQNQGLTLSGGGVFQQANPQQSQQNSNASASRSNGRSTSASLGQDSIGTVTPVAVPQTTRGVLDVYA